MSVTRSQLGILVAVFVGGAASGVVGWSLSRPDEPKEKRASERTEEALRGVDREELKRALIELGFRLDEPEHAESPTDARERPSDAPRDLDGAVAEIEGGTPVSEVLAALERSYMDQRERERAASAAPVEVDVVADLVPDAAPFVEEESAARVAQVEPQSDAPMNDAPGALASSSTHIGDVVQNTVVQNTTVQNTVQQVQVYQPIFFNPGFNPGFVGAPAPQRRAPSGARSNDVFRPVDLNAHYVNPFSSPPPWIAR